MNTLRKPLALCLALLMLLTVLSGCGSKPANTDSPTDTQEPSAPTQEAEDPKPANDAESADEAPTDEAPADTSSILPIATDDPTLSMWVAYTSQYYPNGYADSVIPDWVYEKTGVHLEFFCASSATATEQFNLMMVSGATDDMIANMSSYYPMGEEFAVEEGLIVDMTDYVAQYMPNYQAARNLSENHRRASTTDSGVVGYIWTLTETPEAPWTGLMIRQDLLNEQGLELPQTINDWDNVLTVLHENYGGTLNIPTNGIFTYSDFASAFGIGTQWYQVDGTVKYGALEEGYKDYLALMADWYSRGLIYPDFTGLQFGDLFALMGANDGIFALDTLWGFGGDNWIERGLTQEPNLFFQGVVHPTSDSGEKAPVTFKSSLQSGNVAVTDAAEDPVLCAKFLDYWYTEQGGWEWSLGPEGISWYINEAGDIDMTEAFDAEVAENKANGMDTAWENTLRKYAAFNHHVGIYHYERLLLQYDDTTIYDATCRVWTDDPADWNYPAEATMTASEQEAYGRIYSDASTIIEEYTCNIIVGNTSVEEGYNQMIAALQSVNFQKCVDCKQAALDRYIAR